MTFEERTAAVAAHGFTERQAAFLTTVMLHAGVCVPRQYAAFAGIVLGHTTREFFEKLTDKRFATAYPCWQGSARVYHVHRKELYRAIGEPDNRHRRPTTVARAVERLMLLDSVLADRGTTWLATERDKVDHFVGRYGLEHRELPALVFSNEAARTARYFPHKLPIGLAPAGGHVVFLYLVTDATGRDFRAFLEQHRSLLHRLNRWSLRLCVPASLASSQSTHEAIVASLVAPPLRPAVLDELRWFYNARRAAEEQNSAPATLKESTRYTAARRAFGAPRFYAVYRRWLAGGDTALNELRSPRLHDAWQRGDGRLDIYVLPHQYLHLAPAVATA